MSYDLKAEWEKTKKQLIKFGQEASHFAKKGEKEVLKISHKGKVHLDSTALNLKKERLYYQIGKAYASSRTPSKPSVKLKKLLEDLKILEGEQKKLKSQIRNFQSTVVKPSRISKTKKRPVRKSTRKKNASK